MEVVVCKCFYSIDDMHFSPLLLLREFRGPFSTSTDLLCIDTYSSLSCCIQELRDGAMQPKEINWQLSHSILFSKTIQLNFKHVSRVSCQL